MEDPRVLRRILLHSLVPGSDSVDAFTESLHQTFQDQALLTSALLPLSICGEVSHRFQRCCAQDEVSEQSSPTMQGVPETGDSLIRLLLNITAIQTPLASLLLKQLPSYQEAVHVDSTDALPKLVLGSLRWCVT